MKRNARGFTLMELMVVIVIVAILAAVAVPLYINYVKDAQRTEAKGAIGAVITAEQTYFQQNATYASLPDPGFVSSPGPGSQNGLNCDLTEALVNWKITVDQADAAGYSVSAVGKTGKQTAGLTVNYEYKRNGTGAGFTTP
ncbi:MAG: prepilin-type N-terminal cleavage/methylation domain-containing protein [Candidatus Eisenbacteria bacterium]|nr:prepilin-type N-terminal cleavage/methylation domain-containing protein [Candidatus Eisenbacteria bacterium]